MSPSSGPDVGELPADLAALADRLAGGDEVRPVWRNELGGVTVALGADRFLKWSPPGAPDLGAEAVRLAWAAPFTPVPRVLDVGPTWMLTTTVPGRSAVDPRWLDDPGTAARAIGRGLRALHDQLPVATCPFSWSAADRLATARERGRLDPAAWHSDHAHLDVASALDRLADPPPVDHLAVCHGDACAPNTLLTDDGRFSGHVDLGALGVADRWADLAVATWSTGWNYEGAWEGELLAAYGVDPDPARTAFYRLLWDLGP